MENRAGDLRCPSVKTAAMASLQGSWCCFEQWGGRVGRGGALGGVGEARRWLWPRRTASVATGAFGRTRAREIEEGGRSREREGEVQGTEEGRVAMLEGPWRRGGSRRWPDACSRAPATRSSS